MSFINTTQPADAEGDVLAMYQRQQNEWGYVPNYARAFCHRPRVMGRWGKLLAEIRRPLDTRRYELITFAAAHALRNSSCALAHGNALTDFFETEEICSIAKKGEAEGLTDAERVMVSYARKVALDASAITSEDVDQLKLHGFSDADIFDIAATAAARSFFTKILDSLGNEPDANFMKIEPQLREALTVGRPIGDQAPERVAEE